MDDQPEATVRAGHTGHGRFEVRDPSGAVISRHEGIEQALEANRLHEGKSQAWLGDVAMTMPKKIRRYSPCETAHQMERVSGVVERGVNLRRENGLARFGGGRYGVNKPTVIHRTSHPGLDPAGAEWLAKVGTT